MWEEVRGFHALPGAPSAPGTSVGSATQKPSEPHVTGIFTEASSRRHDLLLVLFPAPAPSLENGR